MGSISIPYYYLVYEPIYEEDKPNQAFTQVLQKRFSQVGDEKATTLLGKMDAQINKLTALNSDLLDVTKIEAANCNVMKISPLFLTNISIKEYINEKH